MNAPRTMPTLHTLHLIGLTLCLLIANATNPVFAQTTEPSVAVSTTTTVPNEVDSVGYMPPVPFVGRIDIGGTALTAETARWRAVSISTRMSPSSAVGFDCGRADGFLVIMP